MNRTTTGVVTRRTAIQGGIAATASIAMGNAVQARRVGDALALLELHPVRFMAGLLFDIAIAVVVKLASDEVVDAIRRGQSVGWPGTHAALPHEPQFRHANYKASAVTLGLVDWREHQRRKLEIVLKESRLGDRRRFQAVTDYLVKERIRIKLAEYTWPLEVWSGFGPDDLLTVDYLVMNGQQKQHYENLIGLTGVTAFERFYGLG